MPMYLKGSRSVKHCHVYCVPSFLMGYMYIFLLLTVGSLQLFLRVILSRTSKSFRNVFVGGGK